MIEEWKLDLAAALIAMLIAVLIRTIKEERELAELVRRTIGKYKKEQKVYK